MKTVKEEGMLIRLEQYTTEYVSLEHKKEEYFRNHSNKPLREVIVSLYLQQEYIDTLIRKICKLVRRLYSNDITFDNEIAKMVFDMYDKEMKRGLSSLI